jgi:hypothetical protein
MAPIHDNTTTDACIITVAFPLAWYIDVCIGVSVAAVPTRSSIVVGSTCTEGLDTSDSSIVAIARSSKCEACSTCAASQSDDIVDLAGARGAIKSTNVSILTSVADVSILTSVAARRNRDIDVWSICASIPSENIVDLAGARWAIKSTNASILTSIAARRNRDIDVWSICAASPSDNIVDFAGARWAIKWTNVPILTSVADVFSFFAKRSERCNSSALGKRRRHQLWGGSKDAEGVDGWRWFFFATHSTISIERS